LRFWSQPPSWRPEATVHRHKRTRVPSPIASAPGFSPAAVLQADSTTPVGVEFELVIEFQRNMLPNRIIQEWRADATQILSICCALSRLPSRACRSDFPRPIFGDI